MRRVTCESFWCGNASERGAGRNTYQRRDGNFGAKGTNRRDRDPSIIDGAVAVSRIGDANPGGSERMVRHGLDRVDDTRTTAKPAVLLLPLLTLAMMIAADMAIWHLQPYFATGICAL
ncbi:hypothetical protein GUJ93_ZPchr0013g34558 [Zizania palustris]|uniref:Uncharacterized protein n=1 Tax=Zizania palustris TaxID=103762 RepID=A0A8J5WW62_ZIZPA|nr:hypothetical protein GUJ93_ZPchr0013g34558 [Zizania palustris]